MKIIGLTGGIGSGKTTVSKIFASLGVPVFFADDEAKKLYEDPEVIEQAKSVLQSNDIVDDKGKIIRQKIATIIFNDEKKRSALNQLLHPLVKKRFDEWMSAQSFSYCIREAAILIESGSYKDCDEIIVVASSMEKRINRVMERDGVKREDVEKRINSQITDDERMKYANFVIQNNSTTEDLYDQVLKIHQQLS